MSITLNCGLRGNTSLGFVRLLSYCSEAAGLVWDCGRTALSNFDEHIKTVTADKACNSSSIAENSLCLQSFWFKLSSLTFL